MSLSKSRKLIQKVGFPTRLNSKIIAERIKKQPNLRLSCIPKRLAFFQKLFTPIFHVVQGTWIHCRPQFSYSYPAKNLVIFTP
jgi:hypothetical protein